MSAELCFLSIAEASDLMRKRKLSPLELTRAHLARIEALDGALRSFITVTGELALRQARLATERPPSGRARGLLFGIPVRLKDNIATEGVRTTAASRVLEDWVPPADASVVRRLKAAGAILLGKAALSEFTFAGGSTADDFVKPPQNPWNLERSAGGSSNGSAVGVAAGLAMASIGSDSGGSIRIPAAFCGVTGVKPTYGRIGRTGVVPLSYSLDHIGPIARTVEDAALMLDAMCGRDPSDASTRSAARRSALPGGRAARGRAPVPDGHELAPPSPQGGRLSRRRTFLKTVAAAGAVAAASRPLLAALPHSPALERARATSGPLRIRAVEAIVIRAPRDQIRHQDVVAFGAAGATSGGGELWDRLDHSSPTRQKGYEQATLVKITTDEGLVGWGEAHAPAAPRTHQRIVEDLFAPVLVGQDARHVEPLWERLYATERVRGYSTGSHVETISGVDIAPWDLLGKYAGVPVYQLLGGRYRDEIATYATFSGTYQGRGDNSLAAVAARAKEMVGRGFKVIKMALRTGPGTEDFARVHAVSDALRGIGGQLLVDSLGAFKLHEAVLVGKELDAMGNIGWFEDPLLPDDMERYPILAERLDVALCAGEALSNRFQFRDLLATRGVDVVNPDLGRAGGITECRRIAWVADVFGILWAPHVSTGSAPYMAASVHLGVATPNAVMMEVYDGLKHEGPFGNVLLKEPLDMAPGVARPPERPGLGVDFDPAALARVTVA